jgi:putative nucleotidyltransferase with HDIG domain
VSRASAFLIALAKALQTMILYQEGHPARDKALRTAHERVLELQEESTACTFTFLGQEVVFGERLLRDLKSWDWGPRLAAIGIQRLEFVGPVTMDDFEAFMEETLVRMTAGELDTAETRQTRPTNIRYGAVAVKEEKEEAGESEGERLASSSLKFSMREEADAVQWLHQELKNRSELHLLEAESIVRSLSVAMHGDQAFLMPLLRLKKSDEYTTTHALNVSVLAMALAEYIGLGPREVKGFGISGLLHDLGKTRVPDEILNKPGKLSPEERAVMNTHTTEGARIILETEDHLDLAAVVAYEHHIKLNGGGYPTLKHKRACHPASDLVHVCDVYDALRTNRPYREAWESDRVIDYIKEGAGTEFNPHLANAFVGMMKNWDTRIAELEDRDQMVSETSLGTGLRQADDGMPSGPDPAPGDESGLPVEVVESSTGAETDPRD